LRGSELGFSKTLVKETLHAALFLHRRRREIEADDPHGMLLPDTAAALVHAEHIIDQLRKAGIFNDDLTIVVKNELHETVLNRPFRPANA
jgi:hypothetical protein